MTSVVPTDDWPGRLPPEMASALLGVVDLRTVFVTDEGIVRAVDGVSFSIQESERMAIVGESGSGKSVTAASIMRLIEPPGAIIGGRVIFRGKDLLEATEPEMQRIRGSEIAMIFQDPMTALDPMFTVGDQMIQTLRAHDSISKKAARSASIDALGDVHIPNPRQRIDDYPHQFSGGMRQRVVIAMALMCRPALVIADEPTTALDVTTQAQVLDLMLSLTEELNTAVILITHDLGVVAGFCEKVHVMYAGRLVERGSSRDVYGAPCHPYTKGLLDSVTRLDREATERLPTIGGSPPSLISLPAGCRFHPRCAHADGICMTEEPPLVDLGLGRLSACHLAETFLPQTHGRDR